MTLDTIIERLRSSETIDPGTLADFSIRLSGEYSYYSARLESILAYKAEEWLKLRAQDGVKSDTYADRLWDRTEQGINEMRCKLRLKSIEKMLSAIKTRSINAGIDYRNQRIN